MKNELNIINQMIKEKELQIRTLIEVKEKLEKEKLTEYFDSFESLEEYTKGDDAIFSKKWLTNRFLKKSGMPWTPEEECKLHNNFKLNNASIEDLAIIHQRSKGAILSRLSKMNLVRYDININKYVKNWA